MKYSCWKRPLIVTVLLCLMQLTFTVSGVTYAAADNDSSARQSIGGRIASTGVAYRGVPYVWGGASPRGFDCSGFVMYVYGKNGVQLPRTADVQFAAGRRVVGSDVRPGDVLFFQTYERGASHCGIYLGQGQFVHASSSQGVMVSRVTEQYWRLRYLGARRFI